MKDVYRMQESDVLKFCPRYSSEDPSLNNPCTIEITHSTPPILKEIAGYRFESEEGYYPVPRWDGLKAFYEHVREVSRAAAEAKANALFAPFVAGAQPAEMPIKTTK